MEMYKKYIEELYDNASIVFNSKGFLEYRILGEGEDKELYIKELGILKEFRKTHGARDLADQVSNVARDLGCKYLSASMSPLNENPDVSMKVILSYGFKPLRAEDNVVWFIKEL